MAGIFLKQPGDATAKGFFVPPRTVDAQLPFAFDKPTVLGARNIFSPVRASTCVYYRHNMSPVPSCTGDGTTIENGYTFLASSGGSQPYRRLFVPATRDTTKIKCSGYEVYDPWISVDTDGYIMYYCINVNAIKSRVIPVPNTILIDITTITSRQIGEVIDVFIGSDVTSMKTNPNVMKSLAWSNAGGKQLSSGRWITNYTHIINIGSYSQQYLYISAPAIVIQRDQTYRYTYYDYYMGFSFYRV